MVISDQIVKLLNEGLADRFFQFTCICTASTVLHLWKHLAAAVHDDATANKPFLDLTWPNVEQIQLSLFHIYINITSGDALGMC